MQTTPLSQKFSGETSILSLKFEHIRPEPVLKPDNAGLWLAQ